MANSNKAGPVLWRFIGRRLPVTVQLLRRPNLYTYRTHDSASVVLGWLRVEIGGRGLPRG